MCNHGSGTQPSGHNCRWDPALPFVRYHLDNEPISLGFLFLSRAVDPGCPSKGSQ